MFMSQMCKNASRFLSGCLRGQGRRVAKFAAIVCILVTSLTSGTAATYYVDFVGGSDSNNGTSTSTPFQHCPKDASATGTAASVTLAAGDTINFKGGVIYKSGTTIGSGLFQTSGTSNAPITFQTAANWGSGMAVLDGTIGGTNGFNNCFSLGNYSGADWTTISGLEIKNYFNAIFTKANSTIVTNCLIHHIGRYPFIYTFNTNTQTGTYDAGSWGYGVNIVAGHGTIVVSNVMYDLNVSAVSTPAASTGNVIVWGNVFSNIQDHVFIGGNDGYMVWAYNTVHDQTNQVTHDDNFHIQGFDKLVFCGNKEWNGNQDCYLNPSASQGTAWIFNNVVFQTLDLTGLSGCFNGIICQTWFAPVTNIFVFNNTIAYKNSGSTSFRVATTGTNSAYAIKQVFLGNNLFYHSRNYMNYSNAYVKKWAVGYNGFTNAAAGNLINSNELNSVYGPVTFVNLRTNNLPASDWHLAAGSMGIGQGTNLAAMFPASTFNFLPARYRPDPTKDAAGASRGTIWDIGAFVFPGNTTNSDPPGPPSGLAIIGP